MKNLILAFRAFWCVLRGGSVAIRVKVNASGRPGLLEFPTNNNLCIGVHLNGNGEPDCAAISVVKGTIVKMGSDEDLKEIQKLATPGVTWDGRIGRT